MLYMCTMSKLVILLLYDFNNWSNFMLALFPQPFFLVMFLTVNSMNS